jgi:hypothetical protein
MFFQLSKKSGSRFISANTRAFSRKVVGSRKNHYEFDEPHFGGPTCKINFFMFAFFFSQLMTCGAEVCTGAKKSLV